MLTNKFWILLIFINFKFMVNNYLIYKDVKVVSLYNTNSLHRPHYLFRLPKKIRIFIRPRNEKSLTKLKKWLKNPWFLWRWCETWLGYKEKVRKWRKLGQVRSKFERSVWQTQNTSNWRLFSTLWTANLRGRESWLLRAKEKITKLR